MLLRRTPSNNIVTFNFAFIPAAITAFFLAGCENTQNKGSENVAPVIEETQTVAVDIEPEVIAPAVVEQPTWQYDINQLLYEADSALAADRLTTPIEDNAFDRYHAVLLIEPGNKQAEQGLEEIFQRYVVMAQAAIRGGELGKARALIERARSVNSESTFVDQLVKDLNALQRERARTQPQIVIEPNQKEIPLSVDGLNRRDDATVEQLQSFAMQVKDSDETLLIIARSDSEGRWIYQKMADGVPGYRLRGDIRLGREPKLLLLPPIE